jgi:hypothetical protein
LETFGGYRELVGTEQQNPKIRIVHESEDGFKVRRDCTEDGNLARLVDSTAFDRWAK